MYIIYEISVIFHNKNLKKKTEKSNFKNLILI